MAGTDNERIMTDLPTLAGALRQAIGTRAEVPARFLYELNRSPDKSISEVAGDLNTPPRTAFRWLKWYRDGGLHAYLSRPWRESSAEVDGSSTSRFSLPDISDQNHPEFFSRVMDALPRVSTASTPREWGKEMKLWVRDIFPEVDRVGVTLFGTLDLLHPRMSPEDVLHHESINTAAATEGEAAVHSVHYRGESIWLASYRSGLSQNAFREEEFHPPIGQDYFYRRDREVGMIGSIVLLKSASRSPVSDTLKANFERIDPLIVRLMSEAVGRMQLENPFMRDFRFALPRLDRRGRLKGRIREIALLHLGGYSNEQIADEMKISPATVKSHTATLLQTLGFASVKEMMAWVISPRSVFTPRKEE